MKPFDMNTQLVPFGKYKGQPMEVMQMDKKYCDWLSNRIGLENNTEMFTIKLS